MHATATRVQDINSRPECMQNRAALPNAMRCDACDQCIRTKLREHSERMFIYQFGLICFRIASRTLGRSSTDEECILDLNKRLETLKFNAELSWFLKPC